MGWRSTQGGLCSCLLDHRGSRGRCKGAIGPRPSETNGPLQSWRAASVSAINTAHWGRSPCVSARLVNQVAPLGTSQILSISSTQRACRMLLREAPLLTSPPRSAGQSGHGSQWPPGELPRVHSCSGKLPGPSRRHWQNCVCKPCFDITGSFLKGPGSNSSSGLRV